MRCLIHGPSPRVSRERRTIRAMFQNYCRGHRPPQFSPLDTQGKVDRKAALVTLAIVLIVVVEGTAAAPPTGSPKPQQ